MSNSPLECLHYLTTMNMPCKCNEKVAVSLWILTKLHPVPDQCIHSVESTKIDVGENSISWDNSITFVDSQAATSTTH